LLILLGFFALTNFLVNMVAILATPAILSMADARVLGLVMSVGGLGMLAGSLLMTAWGGPKRQIYAVLGFVATLGFGLFIAGLHPSPLFFATGAFLAYFSLPLFQGSGQTILQSKVALGVQGRVFSLRGMVVSLAMLVAFLGAGPLADHVFEPLLAAEGSLADSVGMIIGVGPGRGIGLMFVLMGLLTVFTALGGLLVPSLRRVDRELPDFDLDRPAAMEQKPETPAFFSTAAKVRQVDSRQSATLS
jgi:MFS family permease